MAQDTAKNVRPTISSIGMPNLRTGAKVNLHLFAGLDFHAPKSGFVMAAIRLHESIDGPVLAVEPVVGDQVLMDAFGGQAKLALAEDELTKWFALTASGNRVRDRFGSRWLVAGPGWRLGTV